MIHNCFLFFDELDLLDLRLAELGDVVDQFVLLECTHTISGFEKPLYYDPRRTQGYNVKRVLVDPPSIADVWEREAWYRSEVVRHAAAAPDDVILVGDADEIPGAADVAWMAQAIGVGEHFATNHLHHYYHMNMRGGRYIGHRMARAETFESVHPQYMRGLPPHRLIPSGWHYSFLGGTEAVLRKLHAYAHMELDHPPFNDPQHVAQCIESGRDLFKRGGQYHVVPIDDSFPGYVREHEAGFRAKGMLR